MITMQQVQGGATCVLAETTPSYVDVRILAKVEQLQGCVYAVLLVLVSNWYSNFCVYTT
jgi:hypothetical protein